MTKQFAVVMSDHIIDLIYAQQDDDKAGENAEIGGEVIYTAEKKVFGDPDKAGHGEDGGGEWLLRSKKAPDPELPEDQDPFEKGVGVCDRRVAGVGEPDIEIAGRLGRQSGDGHQKKGPVGFAHSAETYQPRHAR